jgi:hypothetical protein
VVSTRLRFVGALLEQLMGLVPLAELELAGVVVTALAHQVDLLVNDVRADIRKDAATEADARLAAARRLAAA